MRSPRDLRCTDQNPRRMWAPVARGGISNELGGRALSTVDPGPSLGSEDRCRVSHVSRNDTRLAGYATEPSASRARECGSAQGSRERGYTRRLQKTGKCRVTSISSTNGVHPGGSPLVVQAVERASLPSRERSSTFGSPDCHRTKRHRGAMTATGAELDDGFQLGDAIRWLIFLVPWSAFSLYCLLALSAQLGPLGIVEAVALSLVSLPFWRRVCRRPAYLPYTALLRRHLAKSADSAGFEDTSAAGVTANPGLAWVKTVEERTESMQEELGAFLRSTACRTPEDDFAESDDNAADDDARGGSTGSAATGRTAKERRRRERERNDDAAKDDPLRRRLGKETRGPRAGSFAPAGPRCRCATTPSWSPTRWPSDTFPRRSAPSPPSGASRRGYGSYPPTSRLPRHSRRQRRVLADARDIGG